jgi:hypothetical protein
MQAIWSWGGGEVGLRIEGRSALPTGLKAYVSAAPLKETKYYIAACCNNNSVLMFVPPPPSKPVYTPLIAHCVCFHCFVCSAFVEQRLQAKPAPTLDHQMDRWTCQDKPDALTQDKFPLLANSIMHSRQSFATACNCMYISALLQTRAVSRAVPQVVSWVQCGLVA